MEKFQENAETEVNDTVCGGGHESELDSRNDIGGSMYFVPNPLVPLMVYNNPFAYAPPPFDLFPNSMVDSVVEENILAAHSSYSALGSLGSLSSPNRKPNQSRLPMAGDGDTSGPRYSELLAKKLQKQPVVQKCSSDFLSNPPERTYQDSLNSTPVKVSRSVDSSHELSELIDLSQSSLSPNDAPISPSAAPVAGSHSGDDVTHSVEHFVRSGRELDAEDRNQDEFTPRDAVRSPGSVDSGCGSGSNNGVEREYQAIVTADRARDSRGGSEGVREGSDDQFDPVTVPDPRSAVRPHGSSSPVREAPLPPPPGNYPFFQGGKGVEPVNGYPTGPPPHHRGDVRDSRDPYYRGPDPRDYPHPHSYPHGHSFTPHQYSDPYSHYHRYHAAHDPYAPYNNRAYGRGVDPFWEHDPSYYGGGGHYGGYYEGYPQYPPLHGYWPDPYYAAGSTAAISPLPYGHISPPAVVPPFVHNAHVPPPYMVSGTSTVPPGPDASSPPAATREAVSPSKAVQNTGSTAPAVQQPRPKERHNMHYRPNREVQLQRQKNAEQAALKEAAAEKERERKEKLEETARLDRIVQAGSTSSDVKSISPPILTAATVASSGPTNSPQKKKTSTNFVPSAAVIAMVSTATNQMVPPPPPLIRVTAAAAEEPTTATVSSAEESALSNEIVKTPFETGETTATRASSTSPGRTVTTTSSGAPKPAGVIQINKDNAAIHANIGHKPLIAGGSSVSSVSSSVGAASSLLGNNAFNKVLQNTLQTNYTGKLYFVEFKISSRWFIAAATTPQSVKVQDFVVVSCAHGGEDVGVVTETLTMKAYLERCHMKHTPVLSYSEFEHNAHRVLRFANAGERHLLSEKFADEQCVVDTSRDLIHSVYRIPVLVVDAEYQFDRNKLTVYYDADHRVDLSDFVKHLYDTFKAAIWMSKVDAAQVAPHLTFPDFPLVVDGRVIPRASAGAFAPDLRHY